MTSKIGDFEIAKSKMAIEALKHAQAYGSPAEIAGARREAEMARLALIAVRPEAAALDDLRKALLHPIRVGGRKKV